jgi:hypothetical protein
VADEIMTSETPIPSFARGFMKINWA